MHVRINVFFLILTEVRAYKSRHDFEPASVPLARKVDVYPEHFAMPVPFGHIYKDGFGDTSFGFKAPIDLLELSMREPRNLEEAKHVLDNANPENIQFYADRGTNSRRYETLRDKLAKELGIRDTPVSKNDTFKWYSLPDMHERNLGNVPLPKRRVRPLSQQPVRLPPPPKLDMLRGLGDVKYNELYFPPKRVEFTTCDEFGAKAFFHPNDVVNLEWIPFYIWSFEMEPTVLPHKFTYATKVFVNQYRTLYRHVDSIQWNKPKLMLKGRGDFLLVSADKRGLFHALPVLTLPDNFDQLNVTLPFMMIRLKIHDPYLAIMFCEQKYAAIMAVSANVPPTDREKTAEAECIGFRGPGMPVERNRFEEQLMEQRIKESEALQKTVKSPESDNMAPQSPLPF